MKLTCPKCGTRDARISHRRSLAESFKTLFGIYPLRCPRCRARWFTSVWEDSGWKYARCPRCYRQELSTWSEQYYRAPTWTIWMLRLGATPYRCPVCRCNFAGFRACRERLTWRSRTDRPDTETPLRPQGVPTDAKPREGTEVKS
jgi:hypothetical protein